MIGEAGGQKLCIDPKRMLLEIDALAAIDGRSDGSCCRMALTESDRKGRDLIVESMGDAGMAVTVDQIGNIIGVRSGRETLAPVMTGSHIDTVATGGRFDGAYGVVAGIEAIRSLNDAGVVTRRPLAVAVFTNEEGARFQPDMMGSLVFAGGLSLADALASADSDGTLLGHDLERIGYAGAAICGEPRPHAFVELHIEQGPILDRAGERLGAVQDLQAISWFEIVIQGTSNHAGTTPMSLRHDAAYCAAEIATFVRSLTQRIGPGQVGTVGQMRLIPNLINVIAREAIVGVDLRNTDEALLQAAEQELAAFLDCLAEREGVVVKARRLARTSPVQFDEGVVQMIEKVASDLGHPIRRMTSGAGHDAQMMARICPTAMIFVPSIGGISHNPREDTHPEDLECGANILLNTLVQLAEAA